MCGNTVILKAIQMCAKYRVALWRCCCCCCCGLIWVIAGVADSPTRLSEAQPFSAIFWYIHCGVLVPCIFSPGHLQQIHGFPYFLVYPYIFWYIQYIFWYICNLSNCRGCSSSLRYILSGRSRNSIQQWCNCNGWDKIRMNYNRDYADSGNYGDEKRVVQL